MKFWHLTLILTCQEIMAANNAGSALLDTLRMSRTSVNSVRGGRKKNVSLHKKSN